MAILLIFFCINIFTRGIFFFLRALRYKFQNTPAANRYRKLKLFVETIIFTIIIFLTKMLILNLLLFLTFCLKFLI